MDSRSLPYQGCVIALFDLTKEAPDGGPDDGDCNFSLGKQCVTALLKQSNELAHESLNHTVERLYYQEGHFPYTWEHWVCSGWGPSLHVDECGSPPGKSQGRGEFKEEIIVDWITIELLNTS